MSASQPTKSRLPAVFAGLLVLDFLLVVVMLATDKNLQTDFGAAPPYYLHWYAGLVLGAVTLLLAAAVLATNLRQEPRSGSTVLDRYALVGGVVWSWLAIAGMFGVLATYKQVGFSSVNQFAQYLFGVSAYPGALSYIPWLYDLLLGVFFVAAVTGVIALVQRRAEIQNSASH
ncbi:MAG: hypothetical protein WA688_02625 [Thermoplasmata archaeon]